MTFNTYFSSLAARCFLALPVRLQTVLFFVKAMGQTAYSAVFRKKTGGFPDKRNSFLAGILSFKEWIPLTLCISAALMAIGISVTLLSGLFSVIRHNGWIGPDERALLRLDQAFVCLEQKDCPIPLELQSSFFVAKKAQEQQNTPQYNQMMNTHQWVFFESFPVKKFTQWATKHSHEGQLNTLNTLKTPISFGAIQQYSTYWSTFYFNFSELFGVPKHDIFLINRSNDPKVGLPAISNFNRYMGAFAIGLLILVGIVLICIKSLDLFRFSKRKVVDYQQKVDQTRAKDLAILESAALDGITSEPRSHSEASACSSRKSL